MRSRGATELITSSKEKSVKDMAMMMDSTTISGI